MLALMRLFGRRIGRRTLNKSIWWRRLVFVFAIVRWVYRRLDRPQIIHVRKGETATVSVGRLGKDKS